MGQEETSEIMLFIRTKLQKLKANHNGYSKNNSN